MSLTLILDFVMQLAVLAILVLRFTRTRRDGARLAAELEAARAVQQVLLPNETPSLPGFRIDSVYRPAGEVGGDFFQIVSAPAGGALAIIGDVSGKGMPAAMTVSLLVGTFRTLAHYTQSPGKILAAMNERMLGRNNGGFTTCLCVRVDADGAMTAANAGHLAPYLDGKELNLENGLPLGLSADADYAESNFTLAPGARLTMLTDGVIEAQSATGELYGFDRTAAISTQAAESIAQAAGQFGQEDDITVLTLSLRSPEAAHG
jgi:serine phosphatase RsbU (regulator of sigma subunit)